MLPEEAFYPTNYTGKTRNQIAKGTYDPDTGVQFQDGGKQDDKPEQGVDNAAALRGIERMRQKEKGVCCCCVLDAAVTKLTETPQNMPANAAGNKESGAYWGFKLTIRVQYIGPDKSDCTKDCTLKWWERWTFTHLKNAKPAQWRAMHDSEDTDHIKTLKPWTKDRDKKCFDTRDVVIEDYPKAKGAGNHGKKIEFHIEIESGCEEVCMSKSLKVTFEQTIEVKGGSADVAGSSMTKPKKEWRGADWLKGGR